MATGGRRGATISSAMPNPYSHPLVWMPDDALARRCSVEQVGTLRVVDLDNSEVTSDLRPDQAMAQRLAGFALMHLARLASGEGRAAVQAACEILSRAYGPAQAPLGVPAQAPAMPEWVDMHKRLAYVENGGLPSEVSTNGGASAPVSTHFDD
jgi:hypothetical protein